MTIGTLGVLAAGTVAGIAVYNVASSSPTEASLLSALPSTPPSTLPSTPFEQFTPADLPAVPVIDEPDASKQAMAPEPVQEITRSDTGTAISRSAATDLVLAQAPGSAINADRTSRNGYQAWAIQVRRSDGSLVTAYVDRVSGVIVDWTLDQEAPAVASVPGYDDDEEVEDEDEKHEQAEPEDDEYGDEDHEGDDD